MDVPTECGGVRVASGDLVFGDVDGVAVIPAAIADKVIALAVTKVAAEIRTRDALLAGELLQDVYARFGVL